MQLKPRTTLIWFINCTLPWGINSKTHYCIIMTDYNLTLCSNQRQVSQCSHQQAPFHSHSGRSSLSTHVCVFSSLATQFAVEAHAISLIEYAGKVLITARNLQTTPVRWHCQSKQIYLQTASPCHHHRHKHRSMVESTTSSASHSHT